MKSNTVKVNSSTFWENYYASHREPAKCSFFAKFVRPFLQKNKRMLEFGCGNARDSIYFAEQGIDILAIDQCSNELDFLTERFSDLASLNFQAADMTRLPTMEAFDYLYSRFTIHAIDKKGEERLITWAAKNIKQNGLFFIEVRSVKDDLFGKGEPLADNAFFTDHYRRFIIIEELETLLVNKGFRILYSLESNGLAQYRDRDPIVIRIIAQKR